SPATPMSTPSLHDALPILAKNIALTETVEQLTIASIHLHRTAANIMQVGNLLPQLQNRRAGLEVAHLHLPGGFIQRLFRQLIKRSEEHTSELQSRENLVCR